MSEPKHQIVELYEALSVADKFRAFFEIEGKLQLIKYEIESCWNWLECVNPATKRHNTFLSDFYYRIEDGNLSIWADVIYREDGYKEDSVHISIPFEALDDDYKLKSFFQEQAVFRALQK